MAPRKQATKQKPNKLARKKKAALAIKKRWAETKLRELIGNSGPESVAGSSNVSSLSVTKLDDKSKDISSSAGNLRQSTFESLKIDSETTSVAAPEYLFVDANILQTLIKKLAFPVCLQRDLELSTKHNLGYCSSLSVVCKNCAGDNIVCTPTSVKLPESAGYDVNRRMTKAVTSLGKGHAALEQFSLIMNMNCLKKHKFS